MADSRPFGVQSAGLLLGMAGTGMGASYHVRYHLPATKVRLTATWTHTRDKALARAQVQHTLTASAADLVVAADERTLLTAEIDTGLFENVSASLALTDDQRLTSASGGSEGQAGAVVTGVLGAAVFAAGVATGMPAVAAGASAIIASAANRFGIVDLEQRHDAYRTALLEKRAHPTDPIEAKYEEHSPVEYHQLVEYRWLQGTLRQEELKLAEQATASPEKRRAILASLGVLRRLRTEVEANLLRLNEHFKAWRATTLETWTEDLTEDVSFDLFPESQNGDLDEAALANEPLKHLWERFGLMIVATSAPVTQASQERQIPADGVAEGVFEREPRQVAWTLWKRASHGSPERVRSGMSVVLDTKSRCAFLGFRKSVWAKRTMKVSFGAGGSLSAVDVEATSSAAAMAQALGNVPSTASSALQQAGQFSDQMYASARSHSTSRRSVQRNCSSSNKPKSLRLA